MKAEWVTLPNGPGKNTAVYYVYLLTNSQQQMHEQSSEGNVTVNSEARWPKHKCHQLPSTSDPLSSSNAGASSQGKAAQGSREESADQPYAFGNEGDYPQRCDVELKWAYDLSDSN